VAQHPHRVRVAEQQPGPRGVGWTGARSRSVR
jgi:hypothetical protein